MCCNHLNRREFIGLSTAGIAGAGVSLLFTKTLSSGTAVNNERIEWDPDRSFINTGKPLKVQPVLMYRIAERKEQTSWKSWGGVQTEQAASEETERITKELNAVSSQAEFPLQILPLIKVKTIEEALRVHELDYEVILIYAATGSGNLLQACISKKRNTLFFVRHRSGPVYYWYEALSVKYLNTDANELRLDNASDVINPSVYDVVVDNYNELLWRLRALYGVNNFTGTRIVALGGAWGKYAPEAVVNAQKKYDIEILEASYADVEQRIKTAFADNSLVLRAEKWTEKYLSLPHTILNTDKKFVINAFLLYKIFKDLMFENNAVAFTIKSCMNTIMPISDTTACLTLGLLNDEGLIAFCESDFVIIPSGILLRHISGKPVFMHNSTFPHDGVVTCAHCSAPRRMDGKYYDPVTIMTHYESEYGAAPKVDIPLGQKVTFVNPEYSTGRWIGFKGVVERNPLYEICRSQQDVRIEGDWKKLIKEVRDSHWMMVYDDYLKELEYAAGKIGIRWEQI